MFPSTIMLSVSNLLFTLLSFKYTECSNLHNIILCFTYLRQLFILNFCLRSEFFYIYVSIEKCYNICHIPDFLFCLSHLTDQLIYMYKNYMHLQFAIKVNFFLMVNIFEKGSMLHVCNVTIWSMLHVCNVTIWSDMYNQTWLVWPFKGRLKYGYIKHVVSKYRFIWYEMLCKRNLKWMWYNTSYCLIEVVTKAGLTIGTKRYFLDVMYLYY